MEKINAIKVNNVSFSYTKNSITLNKINFNILENEYVCIIGHNGSGKSTMSKILTGLLKPSDGDVEIFGEKINHDNLFAIRKHIGIIFQNPDSQFIGLTAEDDIAFGLENQNKSRKFMVKQISEVAEKMKITDLLKKEPQSLSGGQKQKVAIASILSMNPNIIIFDEATSMLDPKGKNEIRNIMLHLKQNFQKTVISITHDMDEVIFADKVIILEKGRLIKVGKPSEIFSNIEFLNKISLDFPFALKLSYLINKKVSSISPTLHEKLLQEELWKIK